MVDSINNFDARERWRDMQRADLLGEFKNTAPIPYAPLSGSRQILRPGDDGG
jgi:hypothetical protein